VKAVEFDVDYRLGEYQAFVLEHYRYKTGKTPGPIARFLVSLFAAPFFFLKKRKLGRCGFTVDTQGIRRRSNHGELSVAWPEVVAVHRYAPGLLVEMDRGAIPIPFRCLSTEQRESCEALLPLRLRSEG